VPSWLVQKGIWVTPIYHRPSCKKESPCYWEGWEEIRTYADMTQGNNQLLVVQVVGGARVHLCLRLRWDMLPVRHKDAASERHGPRAQERLVAPDPAYSEAALLWHKKSDSSR
jgi:hypothetical protein